MSHGDFVDPSVSTVMQCEISPLQDSERPLRSGVAPMWTTAALEQDSSWSMRDRVDPMSNREDSVQD